MYGRDKRKKIAAGSKCQASLLLSFGLSVNVPLIYQYSIGPWRNMEKLEYIRTMLTINSDDEK
jgi:hypothetical protein